MPSLTEKVVLLFFRSRSAVDSGVAGGARASPKFGDSEKRIERVIDNLLLQAPLDLKNYGAERCRST